MNDNKTKDTPVVGRRDFLQIGGVAGTGLIAGGVNATTTALPLLPANPVTPDAMPTRNLGRTGYRVGIFSLGGQAAVEQPNDEEKAVVIVNKALDLGINYVDTAAAYGGNDRWGQKHISAARMADLNAKTQPIAKQALFFRTWA
jgi:hypothetical protein